MTLFIDVDGVLFHSIKRFVELYNRKYDRNINYMDINDYEFRGFLSDLEPNEVDEIFERDDFYGTIDCFIWESIKYINMIKILNIEICFVTKGTMLNCVGKLKLLNYLYPKNRVITLSDSEYTDKSIIDMEGCIFIDDHQRNLNTCSAKYPILLETDCKKIWNEGYKGRVYSSWKEIYDFIKIIVDSN